MFLLRTDSIYCNFLVSCLVMDEFLVDIFVGDRHEVVSVNDTTSTRELYQMVEKKLQVEEGTTMLYFGGCLIEGYSINTCGSLGLRFNPKVTVNFKVPSRFNQSGGSHIVASSKGSHIAGNVRVIHLDRHRLEGLPKLVTNFTCIKMHGQSKRINLVSKCHSCPNVHESGNKACESCNDLTNGRIVDEIVTRRSDAWLVVCEVFNNYFSDDIKKMIEENSSSSSVRLIDVMHHLYHSDPTLTWDIIRNKVERKDSDLTKAIADSLKH